VTEAKPLIAKARALSASIVGVASWSGNWRNQALQ
jgi:hypothetical protein